MPPRAATAAEWRAPLNPNLGAAGVERPRCRLRDGDHVAGERGVVAHVAVREDRPREVPQLEAQRLVRLELRRDDVAGPVGELVLAERLRIGVDDAVIEEPDRLRAPSS